MHFLRFLFILWTLIFGWLILVNGERIRNCCHTGCIHFQMLVCYVSFLDGHRSESCSVNLSLGKVFKLVPFFHFNPHVVSSRSLYYVNWTWFIINIGVIMCIISLIAHLLASFVNVEMSWYVQIHSDGLKFFHKGLKSYFILFACLHVLSLFTAVNRVVWIYYNVIIAFDKITYSLR